MNRYKHVNMYINICLIIFNGFEIILWEHHFWDFQKRAPCDPWALWALLGPGTAALWALLGPGPWALWAIGTWTLGLTGPRDLDLGP